MRAVAAALVFPSMGVAVRVLGPLEVTRDSIRVSLGSAQQRVILTALATERSATVPNLIDAVWGEAAPRDESRTLMKLIYRLRQALGPGVIHTEGPHYRLVADTDLVRFDELLELARVAEPAAAVDLYNEALHLWRGEAVPELSGVAWAEPLRRSLDERRLHAIDERSELLLQLGRHREMVSELVANVAAHPLRSRSVGLLMRALHRGDRTDEALRVLEEHRRQLADETGLEPALALLELGSRIAQGIEPGGTMPRSWLPPTALAPMIGRQHELRRLHTAWEASHGGPSQLVIIDGEPGIGKSRLAAELARSINSTTAVVLHGRFGEHAETPLRALSEAIGPLVDHRPDPAAILGALLRGPHRLLLALDDLQWATTDDLRLVRRLIGARTNHGLLVVATSRPLDGSTCSPDEVEALRRDTTIERIHLEPLDAADLAALAAAVPDVAETWSAAALSALAERTGGNPLYALSVLTSRDNREVPASLEEHLRARVDLLDRDTRTALECASIVGRKFYSSIAAAVAELQAADAEVALADGVRSGLIRATGLDEEDYEFVHDLVRHALIGRQRTSTRERRHAAVAALLHPTRDAAAVADHLDRAGALVDPARRGEALVVAADRANGGMSFSSSEHFARRALEVLGDTGPVELRVRAMTILANTLNATNRRDEARAVRAKFLGDAFRLGGAALVDAVISCSEPDPNDTEAKAVSSSLLRDALAVVGADEPAGRAALLALLALDDEPSRILTDAKLEMINEARQLLTAVDGASPRDGMFAALAEEWILVARSLGGPAEYSRLELRLGGRRGGPFMRLPFAVNRMTGLLGFGQREGCDELIEQLTEAGNYLDAPQYAVAAQMWRATLANVDGRFVSDTETLDAKSRLPSTSSGRWFWDRIGDWSLIERGAADAAVFDRIESDLDAAVPFVPMLLPHYATAAAGHASLGQPERARTLVDRLLDDLPTLGRHAERPIAWRWIPDVLWALGDRDAAQRTLPYIEPYGGQILVGSGTMPLGAADRSIGILHTLLGNFDEAELSFRTGLAVEHGMRSRPFVARSELALARMYSARSGPGDHAKALAVAQAVAREADNLGMAGVRREAGALIAQAD